MTLEQAKRYACEADTTWHAELQRLYGKHAKDARYDLRGVASPRLGELREAKFAADRRLYAVFAERSKRFA